MSALVICGITISQDSAGRFCINDFHRAAVAGGITKDIRPNEWLALHQTKDLIAELNTEPGRNKAVHTTRGRNGGTFVAPELVYAYAMWAQPAFHIKVIRAFHGQMTGSRDWKRMRHESAASYKVMSQVIQLHRQDQGKECAPHHFSNEARLVNWALTGEFGKVDREALDATQLDLLARLEERNTVLIARGVEYAARKAVLEQFAIDWRIARTPALTTQGETA